MFRGPGVQARNLVDTESRDFVGSESNGPGPWNDGTGYVDHRFQLRRLNADEPTQELVPDWGENEALRLMLSTTDPASVEERKAFFERQVKAAAMKESDRLLATVNKWWPEIQTLLTAPVTRLFVPKFAVVDKPLCTAIRHATPNTITNVSLQDTGAKIRLAGNRSRDCKDVGFQTL